MSKKKGTAEKAFEPLYVDGQDSADFQQRVSRNLERAYSGQTADKKYEQAHNVESCWLRIKHHREFLQTASTSAEISAVKKLRELGERGILRFIYGVFERKDGEALRLLAQVVENKGSVSGDAWYLIFYCKSLPHDHVFTFQELLETYCRFVGLKPPFDEGIRKRVRRLIKLLGIRLRKGQ